MALGKERERCFSFLSLLSTSQCGPTTTREKRQKSRNEEREQKKKLTQFFQQGKRLLGPLSSVSPLSRALSIAAEPCR